MKKIKIRFVEFGKTNPTYCIQKKTLFGWKYIKFKLVNGTEVSYQSTDTQYLLNGVLFDYFKLKKDKFGFNCKIYEYPKLKVY